MGVNIIGKQLRFADGIILVADSVEIGLICAAYGKLKDFFKSGSHYIAKKKTYN